MGLHEVESKKLPENVYSAMTVTNRHGIYINEQLIYNFSCFIKVIQF